VEACTGVSTTRRTLFSNGSWSLANQIVRVGTLALVTIALSRHFGPQAFGALAVGLALVRIFAVIGTFGLDRVVVRRVAAEEAEADAILWTAFRLKLLIAFTSYCALLALIACVDAQNTLLLGIVLLAGGGLLFLSCDVFDYFFQARNRFRLTFIGRTLPTLFATALKLSAIILGAPLLVFAALEGIEMALVGAVLFLVYRGCAEPKPKVGRAKGVDRLPLLGEGLPLLLGTLAAMIYMRSDVLLLGRLVGYRAAGLYAAAAQITEGCALFPMAFLPALLPILVEWRRLGEKSYRRQFENLFLGTFLVGALVTVCLTTTAPFVIRALYGTAYTSAAPILAIHAWSAVFLFFSIIQIGYEVTNGLAWLTAARTTAGAILNVALNCLLIPLYGAVGSAIATVISLACSGFFFNLLNPASRPIFRLQLKALLLIPLLRLIIPGGRDHGRPEMPAGLMIEQ